jgi:hypothetical protein
MTVAFAALHRRLKYRGEDTGLYGLEFDDGTMFLAKRQPKLYDAMAKQITPREVLPGTCVKVRFDEAKNVNWMTAVQIVRLAEEEAPFDPVLDDGHL